MLLALLRASNNMYYVRCTSYIVQGTMYHVHSTSYKVHRTCTMYMYNIVLVYVHRTSYEVHSTSRARATMYIIVLCILHRTSVYTVPCLYLVPRSSLLQLPACTSYCNSTSTMYHVAPCDILILELRIILYQCTSWKQLG